jgi:hypothetical protein
MKRNFLSAVESRIVEKRTGFRSWFDRLENDQQEELLKIKKKFTSGGYGETSKAAVARAIIAASREEGWKTSGEQGVIAWLVR